MRRLQQARSISERTPWQLLGGQFHNLGSFPCCIIVLFAGEGQTCVCTPCLNYGWLWGTGAKSISSSGLRSKATAAAHIARVRGKEQGTRYLYLERTGEMQSAYSERAERETLLIFILARNQARRYWMYSETYPEHSSLPRMHETQKPSISQGLYISLLVLSASTTSIYSSLGVSRESNPRPWLLKASV